MRLRRSILALLTTSALAIGLMAHSSAAPPSGKGGGGKDKPKLSVLIDPASISENGGTAMGIVSRENSDTSGPLTVTLANSNTSEATVQVQGTVAASVDIPAGEVSATFDVVAINDTVKDGDQTVTISVSATDHSGASASVTVVDDEGFPQIAYVPTMIPLAADIQSLTVNDINDAGMVAGKMDKIVGSEVVQHGVIYDPTVDPPVIIDMHDDITIEGFDYDNWVIASIVGLNNDGLAVGYAHLLPDLTERRGIVLDLNTNPIQIYDLPEDPAWQDTYARKVNDNGDILGQYTRSDGTVGFYLVNLGLRGIEAAYSLETTEDSIYSPSSSLTEPTEENPAKVVSDFSTRDGLTVYSQGGNDVRYITEWLSRSHTNDHGDIAALRYVEEEVLVGKGKKTETVAYFELFLEVSGIQDYVRLPEGHVGGVKINSSGTVLSNDGDEFLLYTSDYGFVDLDLLLTSSVPGNNDQTFHIHMNDVGVDGFSDIAYGYTDPITYEAYFVILTPVALP